MSGSDEDALVAGKVVVVVRKRYRDGWVHRRSDQPSEKCEVQMQSMISHHPTNTTTNPFVPGRPAYIIHHLPAPKSTCY